MGPKKGHSEEQILWALRQAESGGTIREICQEHGINDASFYIRRRMQTWGLSELRELRQLREREWRARQRQSVGRWTQKVCTLRESRAAGSWRSPARRCTIGVVGAATNHPRDRAARPVGA